MYVESRKKSIKRFYHLLIKRHIFGITSPLRVLPDFFVIGPGRTGTTSLFYYLNEHPCLVKSAYDELGFFDVNFHLGLQWYRSLFPTIFTKRKIKSKTNHFQTYDVSPSYVRRPWVAKRMHELFPKSKHIVVLRNPVDKTYSHYYLAGFKFDKNNKPINKQRTELRSFEDVINDDMKNIEKFHNEPKNDYYFGSYVEKSFLARGFYIEQLPIWFKLFSKDQILVISSEDLSLKTRSTLKIIFKFLNLPDYDPKNIEKVSVSNYKPMNKNTRRLLVEYFKPYNEKLYKFLNQKFDWDK